MAHYDVFSAQLAIKFPAYGHALWEPSPTELSQYCAVDVGDVGFTREGRFHRLFNVLLPFIFSAAHSHPAITVRLGSTLWLIDQAFGHLGGYDNRLNF